MFFQEKNMKKTFLLLALFSVLLWGCKSSGSTEPSGNNNSSDFSDYDYQLDLSIVQVPYMDGLRSYGYTDIFMRCKDDTELTNFTCTINGVQCSTEWVVYTISDKKGYNIWGVEMFADSIYSVSIQSDELNKELTVSLPSATEAVWPVDFDSAGDFTVSWASDLDCEVQRLLLTCYEDSYVNGIEFNYEIDTAERGYTIPANTISSSYTTQEFELRRINFKASGEFVLTARIVDKFSYSCIIC